MIHPEWNKPQTGQTAASNGYSLREQLLPLGHWAGRQIASTGECPTKILRLLLNSLIETLGMRKQARNNGGEKKSDVINRRRWQYDSLLGPPPHMLFLGSGRYPKAYLFEAAFLKMLSEISWSHLCQNWETPDAIGQNFITPGLGGKAKTMLSFCISIWIYCLEQYFLLEYTRLIKILKLDI